MRYLSLMALCGAMLASTAYADNDAYWIDRSGKMIKTSKNLCVRTSKWTEKKADPACMEAAKKSSTPVASSK
jgi:hypothetical protein